MDVYRFYPKEQIQLKKPINISGKALRHVQKRRRKRVRRLARPSMWN